MANKTVIDKHGVKWYEDLPKTKLLFYNSHTCSRPMW